MRGGGKREASWEIDREIPLQVCWYGVGVRGMVVSAIHGEGAGIPFIYHLAQLLVLELM